MLYSKYSIMPCPNLYFSLLQYLQIHNAITDCPSTERGFKKAIAVRLYKDLEWLCSIRCSPAGIPESSGAWQIISGGTGHREESGL